MSEASGPVMGTIVGVMVRVVVVVIVVVVVCVQTRGPMMDPAAVVIMIVVMEGKMEAGQGDDGEGVERRREQRAKSPATQRRSKRDDHGPHSKVR